MLEFVVEFIEVCFMLFVGIYEYFVFEIILGDGYGSLVDWWIFGIFFYEFLYVKMLFKGVDNEFIFINVVVYFLIFFFNIDIVNVFECVKDFICGLLVKDFMKCIGFICGVGEIKVYLFFEGVNWVFICCVCFFEVFKFYRVEFVVVVGVLMLG